MTKADTIELEYFGPDQRLDRAAHKLLEQSGNIITRSQLKRIIELGGVTLNGQVRLKAGVEVKDGDRLAITLPSQAQQTYLTPFDLKLDLVYEDADLLVVNKPAGLSVHPGAGRKDQTLVNALIGHFNLSDFGDNQRPGIVHRLDKDTTGLMVVAKNLAALAGLSDQFSKKSAIRKYQALCLTSPRARGELGKSDHGTISLRLARHPIRRKEFTVVKEGGRSATTNWRILKRLPYAVLLELVLQTGRTHQIRVHLAHLKNPVIGDRVYGDFSSLPTELKNIAENFGRQALHAYYLEFTHPKTLKRVYFNAELPNEMQRLIEKFE